MASASIKVKVNQELTAYIQSKRTEGATDEQIVAQLLQAGWKPEDIQRAFLNLRSTIAPTQVPQNPTSLGSLGVGSILKTSWQFYIARFKVLEGIVVTSMFFFFLSFAAAYGFFQLLALIAGRQVAGNFVNSFYGTSVFVVVHVLFHLWSLHAVMTVITHQEQHLSIRQAYVRSRKHLLVFIWVVALTSFLVIGGALLFIVPGLLLATLLIFSPFVYLAENEKGMRAVLKSAWYAKSKWFVINGHFVVLAALLFIPYQILTMLAVRRDSAMQTPYTPLEPVAQFASFIVIAFLLPFILTYLYHLYMRVRARRGNVSFTPRLRVKGILVTVALLGWLYLPATAIYFTVARNLALKIPQNKQRLAHAREISAALDNFFNDYREYPTTTVELAPRYIARLPKDPESGSDYAYARGKTKYSYRLCPDIEMKLPLPKKLSCSNASRSPNSRSLYRPPYSPRPTSTPYPARRNY